MREDRCVSYFFKTEKTIGYTNPLKIRDPKHTNINNFIETFSITI